jgi:hypothetical protein
MKTEGYGEIHQDGAHNIYYLSVNSNLGHSEELGQTVQFKQVILFLAEFIGVVALFGLLFAGLWLGCAFDDGCWQSYVGVL